MLDCDLEGLPWDVKVLHNRLLVSVHHGKESKASLKEFVLDDMAGTSWSCKATFSRQLTCDHFQEPNMFLLCNC